ncbi:MAG TPA: quinoprotein dehydrogenase-associated putative ABC transporter substrate-binding protein [Stellaceae bacterium]|jgi:mxaJ protein|nr:quinoprotein dehydrogenase-associated putative ABC transporter substrate-binding protein [Stellaceae bacterium]
MPVIAALAALLPPAAAAVASDAPLRVCAARDNMPFSDANGEGFENKLASLVAADLGRPLVYGWLADGTKDPLTALAAGHCDLVIGVPAGFSGVATTHPYYWSSYVLISRTDRGLGISSLKDHRLRGLKIGVASIDGDTLYAPPARALSQSGLGKNLVAYPVDDGGDGPSQSGKIVDAIVHGDVDIAAVWGPSAGYWARKAPAALTVTTIGDTDEFSARKTHFELLGLQYEIAMAVRQDDERLRTALDGAIARDRPRMEAVLKEYGVPLIEPTRLSSANPRGSTE